MSCYSADVIKGVGLLGFVHLWTTVEGSRCFVHPHDPAQAEIFVGPSITEAQAAKELLLRARKIAGWHAPREEYAATRPSRRETAADRITELRDRELSMLERMMTQLPQGGSLNRGSGHVRHWSGSRRR
jgi:hypothetical protein